MKKKNKKKKGLISLIVLAVIIVTGLVLYYTGTLNDLRIKAINMFENTLNRTGLDLVNGIGSLIDEKDVKNLKDSGIKGEAYTFDSYNNVYYSLLEDKEKKIYSQVYANMIHVEKYFKPVTSINKDEINDVVEAVYNDHPEVFWINTNYSYKYIKNGKVVQIVLEYNSTSKNLEYCKSQFEGNANSIISTANSYRTIYEKEKYVHDTLITMNDYNEGEKLNQSAYSALVVGETVCAGYSRAFQYIMNQMGIRTYYITGDSSGDHAWNIIELDGDFYNVDLTWDDQTRISYKYFNVPDSVFSTTHMRRGLSIYLPVCRGNKYYKYESKNTNNNKKQIVVTPKKEEKPTVEVKEPEKEEVTDEETDEEILDTEDNNKLN